MSQYHFLTWIFLALINICSAGTPAGHNKPFGHHKPARVEILEYTIENAPKPQDFFENHVKHSKAAIFRGAMKGSDAFHLWTDEYLGKSFGDLELRTEAKWEKEFMPPIGEKYIGRDSIQHFVDHYHDENIYAVSDLPSRMYHDVGVVPSLGACGEMSRHFVEIDIWWSGGDGRSLIHKDAFNQMNCLLNGTKYWKLIEYKYEKYLYKHPEPEYEVGGFSDIDPRSVDLLRFPDVQNVEWSNFTIHAGDCLYLPKSYYHQVNSVGAHNLAVSILFGRFDSRESLDFSDCTENTEYRKLRRLSEFDVQWSWDGTGMLTMGRGDLEDQFRAELLNTVRECEKKGITFTVEILDELFRMEGMNYWNHPRNFSKVLRLMDKNNDAKVTEEEIMSLSWDDLRVFGDEVEIYEPSNNYNFEYSIIAYERVLNALKYSLGRFEKLSRKNWEKIYKYLGGTKDFANEIFTRLTGNESAILSKDVTKAGIDYALENWRIYWAPQYSELTESPAREAEDQHFKHRHKETIEAPRFLYSTNEREIKDEL